MGPIDSSESFVAAVFSVGTLNTFLECTSIPSKSEWAKQYVRKNTHMYDNVEN